MMTHGYTELREMVLESIAHKIEAAGLTRQEFDDDIDLLQSGLIDSFDFLDLVSMLEEAADVSIDLADIDDEQLVTVRGVIQAALAKASAT
jgi:acyl carrier protein